MVAGGIDGWKQRGGSIQRHAWNWFRRGYSEEQIGKPVERQSASSLGRSREGLPKAWRKQTGLKRGYGPFFFGTTRFTLTTKLREYFACRMNFGHLPIAAEVLTSGILQPRYNHLRSRVKQ